MGRYGRNPESVGQKKEARLGCAFGFPFFAAKHGDGSLYAAEFFGCGDKLSDRIAWHHAFALHPLAHCLSDVWADFFLGRRASRVLHNLFFVVAKMGTQGRHVLSYLRKLKKQKLGTAKQNRKKSYEMPTLGFHVPDDSPLVKEVQAQADAQHDGKVSAYVRQVVERDLAGRVDRKQSMAPTVLVDLARVLLGELDASQMAVSMEGRDQRLKLKRILERVLCEEFDLESRGPEYIREGNTPEEREKRRGQLAQYAAENYFHWLDRKEHRKEVDSPRKTSLPYTFNVSPGRQEPTQAKPEKRKRA